MVSHDAPYACGCVRVQKMQGRLFFYYSPQMLGNNFSTLGKNSKFWKKKKEKEGKFEENTKKEGKKKECIEINKNNMKHKDIKKKKIVGKDF